MSKFISVMSKDQVSLYHQKILENTTPGELVALLQKKFGVYTDVKYKALHKRINAYVAAYKKDQIPMATPVQVEGYVQNYNALEKLTNLCKVQEERLSHALKKESTSKHTGLLMKMATDEIKVLSGMLNSLADVQMRAGLITLAPKVFPTVVSLDNPDAQDDTIVLKVTDELRNAMAVLEDLKGKIT